MQLTTAHDVPTRTAPEHLDVLIVGAGISGISAAHHVQEAFPSRTYAVLEARSAIGGTWDLFRYPGIRSDSDMHTLGYRFRPWTGDTTLASGPEILSYLEDTAQADGIDRHIRLGHRVVRAEWDSRSARWTLDVLCDDGRPAAMTCSFLFLCTGYYRYDTGHAPAFPGSERFGGRIVHPQHWPGELELRGKRVVVIGSGATAVTLVPAIAEQHAEHVTMLQRSPSYIAPIPAEDVVSRGLRRVLGARVAHAISRWKNVGIMTAIYRVSRRHPALVRRIVHRAQARRLPSDFDHAAHLTPSYDPWDQRLCWVPDGDLFTAISDGRASIVTDRIETFTETGIRLTSGRELEADVIVTATGLELLAFGGIELHVDGRPVDLPQTTVYKGLMLGGVPNFAFTFGYTNASWTLKADLVSQFVCRVLAQIDRSRHPICTAVEDPSIERRPLLTLSSGYIARAADRLPRSGDRAPWTMAQNYLRDVVMLRHERVQDDVLRFSDPVAPADRPAPAPEPAAATVAV